METTVVESKPQVMNKEKLQTLARDLRKTPPRSPREKLGGFVIAARMVDKARADLLGTNGEYNFYPCGLGACTFGSSPGWMRRNSRNSSQPVPAIKKWTSGCGRTPLKKTPKRSSAGITR